MRRDEFTVEEERAPIILVAARLGGVLGERGLVAIERLMGPVLITMAVQMFLTEVTRYLGRA